MKPASLAAPILAAALAAALLASAAPAGAGPSLDFALGRSFAIDGSPSGGGMSVAVSPLWDAGDRAHFGVTGFADDIGTSEVALLDRTSGLDLGTVTQVHRMTWGLAWRGDYDVIRRQRWTGGLTALTGWWRIADDIHGNPAAAASAVGFGFGVQARRALTSRHEFGVTARWQELTSNRNAAYRRVDHYATAALEWRWTLDGR